MAGTERDPSTQWDIVSGVGYTALGVAAGRAVESERADRLVHDPYAAALVRAAGGEQGGADVGAQIQQFDMHTYLGVRSRYFDEFFGAAGESGIRQAVVLASGLDTRPQRLSWPEGTAVFEIDQPLVLQFKEQVLREQGATASCEHHPIETDLRDDWPSALLEAGFDRTRPSAWLAEGLLGYLPADAEARLLHTLHEFSAPGSRVALECYTDLEQLARGRTGQIARELGVDMAELLSFEPRPAPEDVLTGHGWRIGRDRGQELAATWNRALSEFEREMTDRQYFLTGSL